MLENKGKFNLGQFFYMYFQMITEVLIFVFFILTFLLQTEVIPTGSMKNNMLIGDHLLLNKSAYLFQKTILEDLFLPPIDIKRGSIVAFKAPPEMEKQYVKRVIGLPGEKLRIVKGTVYIDNVPIKEPWIKNNSLFKDGSQDLYFTPASNFPEIKIPQDHYFVMGDNRNNSRDSRNWGFLPKVNLIGQPWRIYWSFQSKTEEYLTPGIKHKIKDIVLTIKNFFPRTRFKRTFKKFK